jgi:hypothetical protein
MEDRNLSIISPQASLDQVDAIMRRAAAGNAGPVCMVGGVRDRVHDLDGDVRFKMIRTFLRAIRNFGD